MKHEESSHLGTFMVCGRSDKCTPLGTEPAYLTPDGRFLTTFIATRIIPSPPFGDGVAAEIEVMAGNDAGLDRGSS